MIVEEPPTGSVVAINLGTDYQEVWVSNRANVGNWYTTDVPLSPGWHPTWGDVYDRAGALGSPITMLVAGDIDIYRAGFAAGLKAAGRAVEVAIEDAMMDCPDEVPKGV